MTTGNKRGHKKQSRRDNIKAVSSAISNTCTRSFPSMPTSTSSSSWMVLLCACSYVTVILFGQHQHDLFVTIRNGDERQLHALSTLLHWNANSSTSSLSATVETKFLYWNYTKEIVRPHNDNTVIAIVAMGKSRNTYIAERCIRSIRARGEFTGIIMLYTDQLGAIRYNQTIPSWDPKVVIVEGRPDDLQPKKMFPNGTITEIKYRRETLIYKRFKTLVLEYLDYIDDVRSQNRQQRLFDQTRYVFYVDVDNVIANPLQELFDNYHGKVSNDWALKKRELGVDWDADADGRDGFSFFSLWRDPGADNELWQGGQSMHDRHYSKGCEDAWRHEMDNVWRGMDQPLLMNVVNNFQKFNCVVFELPGGEGNHFDLLHTYIFESKPRHYPTLVHITSPRATDYDKEEQEKFIRKALLLSDGKGDVNVTMTPNALPVDSFMVEELNITWRDITQPVATNGIKHQQ